MKTVHLRIRKLRISDQPLLGIWRSKHGFSLVKFVETQRGPYINFPNMLAKSPASVSKHMRVLSVSGDKFLGLGQFNYPHELVSLVDNFGSGATILFYVRAFCGASGLELSSGDSSFNLQTRNSLVVDFLFVHQSWSPLPFDPPMYDGFHECWMKIIPKVIYNLRVVEYSITISGTLEIPV